MIRVAINGFGRIGRAFFRLAFEREDVEIVAVNDLGDIENAAYLLRFDTVYGRYGKEVTVTDGHLVVGGRDVRFLSEPDPSKLPWRDLGIDVVVESTGVFDDYGKANAHRIAGAKRVVISAPVKGEPPEGVGAAMVLMGVNDARLQTCDISSNASCTTNAGSPVIAVLKESFGVEKALLNTVHAYTATQAIVDAPAKHDFLRGRAGAANIVPSSTGAATATARVIDGLDGKFDGIAIRVPVPVGSIVDVTAVLSRDVSADEVNSAFRKAATDDRWTGIMGVTEEPLVSSDIIGDTRASIVDLTLTRVVGGNLVKVMAWYDNEMGYTNALVEHVVRTGNYIEK